MIKGCNKRVLVMKETGHRMIEEAIFIIRSDVKAPSDNFCETDLVRQANMILDSSDSPLFAGVPEREKRKKKLHLKSFMLGALTVSVLFLVLGAVI